MRLLLIISFLFLYFSSMGQVEIPKDEVNPWENIDLCNSKMKPHFTAKVKKKFPWWIPISATVVGGGGIATWLLLQEEDEPQPVPLANDDSFSFSCKTGGVLDVLGNDTGEGLTIQSFTGAGDIQITNQGSSLLLLDVGSTIFYFSYTLMDSHGQQASANVEVNVYDDEEPGIQCPPESEISCDMDPLPDLTGNPVVNDNCSELSGLSIDYEDDLSGMSSNNNTGIIIRTWTVFDEAINSSSCQQQINLVDNEQPTITCPPDLDIQCQQDPLPDLCGFPEVSDNCSADSGLSVEYSDDLSGLNACNETGFINRTWTVVDEAGNAEQCIQKITVVDDEAPVITCPPDYWLSSDESNHPNNTGYPEVSDNCTSASDINLEFSDENDGSGKTLRTWTATDPCGNQSSCEQELLRETIECPFEMEFDVVEPGCGLENGSIKASADASLDITYLWSTGDIDNFVEGLSAGNYSLTITESSYHCTSEFDFELTNQEAEYIQTVDVQPVVCPISGSITLNLYPPADDLYSVEVIFNENHFYFVNLIGPKIAIHDLMFIEDGEYTIRIFNQFAGEECTEEIELVVLHESGVFLTVMEVSPPDNADMNNGVAYILAEGPTLDFPLDIYLNGVYYGQAWEPLFTIENLTIGEYSVYVTVPGGCPSDPVTFMVIGTGLQEDGSEISLGSNFADELLQMEYLGQLLEGDNGIVWKDEFPLKWEDFRIVPLTGGALFSPMLNLGHIESSGFYYGMNMNVGKGDFLLLYEGEERADMFAIPLQTSLFSVQPKIGKAFNLGRKNRIKTLLSYKMDHLIMETVKDFVSDFDLREFDNKFTDHSINLALNFDRTVLKRMKFYLEASYRYQIGKDLDLAKSLRISSGVKLDLFASTVNVNPVR